MRRVARDWGQRAAIVAVIVGGTVWAYLEDAVPIVAVFLIAAGLGIAVLPLPKAARRVQWFVTRVLLFGSVFEIGGAVLENERYEVRSVLIIGAVFASLGVAWDHVSDEEDDASTSAPASHQTD